MIDEFGEDEPKPQLFELQDVQALSVAKLPPLLSNLSWCHAQTNKSSDPYRTYMPLAMKNSDQENGPVCAFDV